MATLNQRRAERRSQRLQALQQGPAGLVDGCLGWEVWMFGSRARGDCCSRSDVDLIASPARPIAWMTRLTRWMLIWPSPQRGRC